MKRLIFLVMLATLIIPAMGGPEVPTEFSLRTGHYDSGYRYYGYWCYSEPSAQIVQAMSYGLGKALDAADGPDKRKEIIDKWLKICEVSRTDVLKYREKDARLREENLKLREELLQLREENLILRTELERQQMEILKLQTEIEKLQAVMVQLQEKAATEQKR